MDSKYYENKLAEEISNNSIDIELYRMMLRDFTIMEDTLKEICGRVWYDYEPNNWTIDLASTILYNIKNCEYGEGKTFPIKDIATKICNDLNEHAEDYLKPQETV